MSTLCKISHCGEFVAVVTGPELQVHSVAKTTRTKTFHIDRIVQLHCTNSGEIVSRDADAKVHLLEWEPLVSGARSTKVAAYVTQDNFHLLMVFDLAEEMPVIIEQDSVGVAHFQWIPLRSAVAESAYSNAVQLAVFLNYGLELRVYSLDCTHVLFAVPKPFIARLAVRPLPLTMWTALALPYYDKNLASRSILASQNATYPVLLQFLNEGAVSTLAALLPLDFLPSSSAGLAWSQSGKWLLCFDDKEVLAGFKLRIFNLLAVHDKPTASLVAHPAQRTMEFTHNDLDGAKDWLSDWGSVADTEYVLAVPSITDGVVKIKGYDITHMAPTPLHTLQLDGELWLQTADFLRKVRYHRMAYLPKEKCRWSELYSFGQYHVLKGDQYVAIARSSYVTQLKFELVTVLAAALTFLKPFKLANDRFVLAFADHVAVLTSAGFEVIATSKYLFKSVEVFERDDDTVVVVVENTPGGPTWRQIHHGTPHIDESNMEIMKRFQYIEDSSKVVNLLKEVELTQKVTPASDVTDTFQQNKRRRA